jgi:hypothetical protein
MMTPPTLAAPLPVRELCQIVSGEVRDQGTTVFFTLESDSP